jgi:two-component system, cell cycle sensor histidine kinase and response regulator CckA
VLEAPNAAEALSLAREHPGAITLLLSDLIMPNMSGQELARELTRQHPETKVLFMSGYAEEAISQHGSIEPGSAFIAKPFSPSGLARAVHDLLRAV